MSSLRGRGPGGDLRRGRGRVGPVTRLHGGGAEALAAARGVRGVRRVDPTGPS